MEGADGQARVRALRRQGGDVGAGISPALGRIDADHVVGVHVNAATIGFMPFPPLDDDEMAQLTEVERQRVARIGNYMAEMSGYNVIQSTRPQTLAYGLADSPVGQLAWIVEKFKEWTHGAEVPEDAVDRGRMLTNVMIYWPTNTAGSSANLYYEGAHSGSWGPGEPSPVPTGVAAFAEDVAIRRYAEQGNNIVHWTDFRPWRARRGDGGPRPVGRRRPRVFACSGEHHHARDASAQPGADGTPVAAAPRPPVNPRRDRAPRGHAGAGARCALHRSVDPVGGVRARRSG